MLIPSTLDPTLAPAGKHVASLFVQYVAPQLPDGRSWDDAKEEFADLVIDTVDAHAPNFKASVIARQVLSPLDLERRFGLVDGDIFHGQLTLDQLFSARPVLGYADYRMPVAGPLPVRGRRASRRRRHRPARPQRGASNHSRSQEMRLARAGPDRSISRRKSPILRLRAGLHRACKPEKLREDS